MGSMSKGAGVAVCGVSAVVMIGFLSMGATPARGPDGQVDYRQTAAESWEAGSEKVGDAAAEGIDRGVESFVDAGTSAILSSEVITGGLVVATGVGVGSAALHHWGHRVPTGRSIGTGWCEEATTGGLVPCAPAPKARPEDGVHGPQGPVVAAPEEGEEAEPVFDLGTPPVLDDELVMEEVPDFDFGDLGTIPPLAFDFAR